MSFDYKKTFRLDSKTLEKIDKLIKDRKYKSRSELIRYAIEKKVNEYESKFDSNKIKLDSNEIELEIPQFQKRALKIIANYEGKSDEEIITDAVNRYVKERSKKLKEEKEIMKKLKKLYGIK